MTRRARVGKSWVGSVESLEGRVLLNAAPSVRGHAHALAAEFRAAHARAQAPSMGALGDSLSDEYRFYPPDRSQARNWVELLGAKRILNFGPFSLRSRGEPRNAGFAQDWAQSQATSADMVANQLPGLLSQVRSGQVGLVSVIVGDNDFGHFLESAPALASDPQALMGRLEQVTASAEMNLDATVNAVLGANPNVKVVVGTIFDISQTPAVQSLAGAFGAQGQQLLQATSEAIGAYNAHVRAVAASNPRVALADLEAVDAAITAQAAQSGGTLTYRGFTLQVATPGDAPNHLLLADGYHPGTVGQGLMADTIVSALDQTFNLPIRSLSLDQIIHLAVHARQLP